ncbi:LytTR family DNA-binding domain-containing protein [Fulvivirga ulvae]|uniref:LytR/AlgR family response regulator transcription factor n=1 Tax=Fulvivirga ulvae TaxID=2904245 RepID=UPI001F194668|nr:LytTR family DNA-binding domain-containing protein [Fulvivirga ulvae]UII29591.1 LytTR family DNA-binding domain-containing protein [Fulvivirga ulvae]
MIKAIAIDDEPLALKVIETLCRQIDFIELQKTFTQPNKALKHLRKFPADLLFVDIHMPGISGINLVKALQQNTMVIFTTAFSEYAAVSYELNAIEYLLKPINKKRFEQAVNKAKDYFNFIHNTGLSEDKHLFVRADFSLVRIPLSDILFIEGMADYLKIFIKDQKTVMTRMTMKGIAEKLPEQDFVRVNRSAIVPVNEIQSIRNKTVHLADREVPIGNTYLEEFFKRFPKS